METREEQNVDGAGHTEERWRTKAVATHFLLRWDFGDESRFPRLNFFTFTGGGKISGCKRHVAQRILSMCERWVPAWEQARLSLARNNWQLRRQEETSRLDSLSF